MKLCLSVIALIAAGPALAQTQVPHQFQAGEPARAAEINENFSALESATNKLSSFPPPLLVEAAGKRLGTLVSAEYFFLVYTEEGYFFQIFADKNTSIWDSPGDLFLTNDARVYYATPCDGQGYIPTQKENATGYSPVPVTQGIVFRNQAGETFYVPKTAVPAMGRQLDYVRQQDGSCDFVGSVFNWTIEILPNDPTITGVPNTPIEPPVRIVR